MHLSPHLNVSLIQPIEERVLQVNVDSNELALKKDEACKLAALKGYPSRNLQYSIRLEGQAQYMDAINKAPDMASVERIIARLNIEMKG